ncbi:MAG: trigger factor [Bacteroidaceae bacterium]|nr:trigger factor [Bacteroidaceae bacterium]
MNISLENVDKVNAVLTVKLEKADYQDKVDASLKNIRKNANMPGFRKGMVPAGLIKKQYGTQVKAEEVNKLLQDGIFNYIKDNKVNMLGEPLTSEKQKPVSFDEDDFEFVFDIALAPEFKVAVSAKDKVDYYKIEVTDEMVDQQVKMYQQRGGSYEKVDSYEAKDMLKGILAELDENGSTKEDGIKVEGAVLMPEYMKNDDQKKLFEGAKVNDVITFNPNTAYDGNEVELASFLKVKKEEVANHKSDFSFQVEEITRFKEAELSQEIFDGVFGKDTVKSEEEFRAKIKENLEKQFEADSDYKFMLDVRAYLKEKVGKLEFPDEKLKKIMLHNNADKGEEFVNNNYDKSIDELTWHLIKEQLVEANSIKIEQADLLNVAKQATQFQFAQYGMMNVPEDVLENYAKEMLKKQDQVQALVERGVENKLCAALKTQVKLNEKSISVEDFNKMFENK